ncbi:hypothetical protein OBBRIDRAFT_384499 [Obba rivulosa]|uniref:Uncharacterized protein n=1 Tax=Obba rivulosa TaxID=1052685 RepID=A0A8E2AQ51_9APHY|nr:hypothetical protein OBBRIDRAFT_384499 [Obba rivulosa]
MSASLGEELSPVTPGPMGGTTTSLSLEVQPPWMNRFRLTQAFIIRLITRFIAAALMGVSTTTYMRFLPGPAHSISDPRNRSEHCAYEQYSIAGGRSSIDNITCGKVPAVIEGSELAGNLQPKNLLRSDGHSTDNLMQMHLRRNLDPGQSSRHTSGEQWLSLASPAAPVIIDRNHDPRVQESTCLRPATTLCLSPMHLLSYYPDGAFNHSSSAFCLAWTMSSGIQLYQYLAQRVIATPHRLWHLLVNSTC